VHFCWFTWAVDMKRDVSLFLKAQFSIRNTQFLANSRSRSLYAIARPSVCLSSVVCNSGGSNFRHYFYSTRYPGHTLTSTENFTEIIPGETPPSGELNTIWVGKYSDFFSTAISRKRCKICGKLLLGLSIKLYISFRLVPKSVTLNALDRRNGVILRYFIEFDSFRGALHTSACWRYT